MLQNFCDQFQGIFYVYKIWSCSIEEFFNHVADFFTVWKHKFTRVLCNCRSQIESNDIEEESATNSILITLPKK